MKDRVSTPIQIYGFSCNDEPVGLKLSYREGKFFGGAFDQDHIVQELINSTKYSETQKRIPKIYLIELDQALIVSSLLWGSGATGKIVDVFELADFIDPVEFEHLRYKAYIERELKEKQQALTYREVELEKTQKAVQEIKDKLSLLKSTVIE